MQRYQERPEPEKERVSGYQNVKRSQPVVHQGPPERVRSQSAAIRKMPIEVASLHPLAQERPQSNVITDMVYSDFGKANNLFRGGTPKNRNSYVQEPRQNLSPRNAAPRDRVVSEPGFKHIPLQNKPGLDSLQREATPSLPRKEQPRNKNLSLSNSNQSLISPSRAPEERDSRGPEFQQNPSRNESQPGGSQWKDTVTVRRKEVPRDRYSSLPESRPKLSSRNEASRDAIPRKSESKLTPSRDESVPTGFQRQATPGLRRKELARNSSSSFQESRQITSSLNKAPADRALRESELKQNPFSRNEPPSNTLPTKALIPSPPLQESPQNKASSISISHQNPLRNELQRKRTPGQSRFIEHPSSNEPPVNPSHDLNLIPRALWKGPPPERFSDEPATSGKPLGQAPQQEIAGKSGYDQIQSRNQILPDGSSENPKQRLKLPWIKPPPDGFIHEQVPSSLRYTEPPRQDFPREALSNQGSPRKVPLLGLFARQAGSNQNSSRNQPPPSPSSQPSKPKGFFSWLDEPTPPEGFKRPLIPMSLLTTEMLSGKGSPKSESIPLIPIRRDAPPQDVPRENPPSRLPRNSTPQQSFSIEPRPPRREPPSEGITFSGLPLEEPQSDRISQVSVSNLSLLWEEPQADRRTRDSLPSHQQYREHPGEENSWKTGGKQGFLARAETPRDGEVRTKYKR
jgi:hypothetical protein